MSMKPVILLRTASVLMFVHFAGHTLGMMSGPSHGAEEIAVIDTMRSHFFDTMGSNRSYWDFLRGFGFDASINMLLQAILFWFLARLARTDQATTRPFIALFAIGWLVTAVLYIRYFFLAAIVFAIVMVIVLAAAWATTNAERNVGSSSH